MTTRIWFDTDQAHEYTGFNPQTIRRAAEAGALHGTQRTVKGRWRFHRDCLDAWILGTPCEHHVTRLRGRWSA